MLRELSGLRPGVTAVAGSGGKTTLLRTLGEELAAERKTVVLCTTTKIFPFDALPCVTVPDEGALSAVRDEHPLLCAGTPLPGGKLAAPGIPMARLAALFDYVLVEADGAARLPLKAHAPYEPAIPPEAEETICLVGASGFGQPICRAAHRPERFAALAGVSVDALATPELTAAVLLAERFYDRVLVNQAELAPEAALRLLSLLDCPGGVCSLREGWYRTCS